MSESLASFALLLAKAAQLKGGFMHFLPTNSIRTFEDALGLGFQIQTEFCYASVLFHIDVAGKINSASIFDQPDHSPIDAIEYLESNEPKRPGSVLLISVGDKDCDLLCDVDVELFGWLQRISDQHGTTLIDWIDISGDQYRSWANTIFPNKAWTA